MKKLIFVCMLLLAGLTFAQVTGVDPFEGMPPVPAAAKGGLDSVILNAAIVASIFAGVQAFKRLLESKWLGWLLSITGHNEVKPFLAVALTICAGLIAGISLYGLDGLSLRELWKLGVDILIANGVHIAIKGK